MGYKTENALSVVVTAQPFGHDARISGPANNARRSGNHEYDVEFPSVSIQNKRSGPSAVSISAAAGHVFVSVVYP